MDDDEEDKEHGAYVLYVGYDRRDATMSRFCPGSRHALELIDEASMHDRVTVQSVDALRETMPALPAWLRGTPTLVSRATRKAMRGSAAIEHLRALPGALAERRGAASSAGGGEGELASSSSAHGLDGMVAPGEAVHLGAESNFEPLAQEDASKYDDSRKVTDADLQRLLERRKASVPPA